MSAKRVLLDRFTRVPHERDEDVEHTGGNRDRDAVAHQPAVRALEDVRPEPVVRRDWLFLGRSFRSPVVVSQSGRVDVQTGARTLLTTGPGRKLTPQWRSDGRIAYVRSDTEGERSPGAGGGGRRPDFWSERIRFVDGRDGPAGIFMGVRWSGDGKQMVFHRFIEKRPPAVQQVFRYDGYLHVRLDPGLHRLQARGPIAGRQLSLDPGTPARWVTLEAPGWEVSGLSESGQIDGSLGFVKPLPADGARGQRRRVGRRFRGAADAGRVAARRGSGNSLGVPRSARRLPQHRRGRGAGHDLRDQAGIRGA